MSLGSFSPWCFNVIVAAWGQFQYMKCHFTRIGIPMVKIRSSWNCLIFIVGIPLLVKTVFYIEMGPYCQTSNISYTFVVGASPVGATPIHLHCRLNTWLQWIGQRQLQDGRRKILSFWVGAANTRGLTVKFMICIGWSLSFTIFGNFNTFRLGQNGGHFAEEIFRCVFFSENQYILIQNSLKFVP